MARRLILHSKLKSLTDNVYFQPPSSTIMKYPCIRYTVHPDGVKHADNQKYVIRNCYKLTIIDGNPDSKIADDIKQFPLCEMDSFYTANNLNHWVFTLYF